MASIKILLSDNHPVIVEKIVILCHDEQLWRALIMRIAIADITGNVALMTRHQ